MDEKRAREILAATADLPGGAADAPLLALGENAVFAVDEVVVKVGRGRELTERAQREVSVARWLEQQQVPAVRAACSGPEVVDGHPVTRWHRLPDPVREPRGRDLGVLLRQLHSLPTPPWELPSRDLLLGVERWLRLAGGAVAPEDADFLRERRDDFTARAASLVPHLPPGPVHGDALPRNVHVGPDGPVLVDLETFSFDLREHDLVVMALSNDRYGLPDGAYDGFVSAYGWDVRDWEGCEVLRGARETASCAWVAQHAPSNPRALTEFRSRVASLREGDTGRRWHAF